MTDKPATLAEALAELQRRLPDVSKAETAHVVTEKGRYSYRYATLADVTQALMPLLGDLGLSFVARPTLNTSGAFVLSYALMHVSGAEVSGEYPLPDPARTSPQGIGSAISYARRYSLTAVTGCAPDEDDDAAQAVAEAPAKPARRTTRTKADTSASGDAGPPVDDASADDDRPLTVGMRTAIQAGFGELGFGGDERRAERLKVAAKLAQLDTLGSVNDLTRGQARKVLDGIAKRKQAQEKGESS